ncbi:MAG: DUF91 domain-containing protein [Euryarchaeota archaeon]|nr:DUF91 domain-containing protein [Euryarchaeota archaeon]
MSDIKLFKLSNDEVSELDGNSVDIEKSLQNLIERHLDSFIGVRFLASEYYTGKTHSGRIDTLGIDENGCPVIIEYKRAINENIINQGLFYLDWLMDHKAEFELLVLRNLGQEEASKIEWSAPRLLCIAGNFTKYDEHAVQQINRNIELIRYVKYGKEILLLELVNVTTAFNETVATGNSRYISRTVEENLSQADEELTDVFEALKAFIQALGSDVQMKALKYYFAFKRLRNFACVEIQTRNKVILVYVKVDPSSIDLQPGFTRDVRQIGHYGTGDLEITIRNKDDLKRAEPLIMKSYGLS